MDLLLILTYAGLCIAIFKIFKIPLNKWTVPTAVLGGIGSMPGAVLGSLVLGMSESFFTGYISSDYEDVFAFLFLVFTLIFRPSGILGRKDTDKV